MLIRRRFSLMAALLILSSLRAAQAEVAMAPFWGFNGFHRPGCWTPLVVEIENFPTANSPNLAKGSDFVGRVTATAPSFDGKDVVVESAVNVPWQTRKRYTLYVKASDDDRVEVTLRLFNKRGGMEKAAVFKTKPIIEPARIVAALSNDPMDIIGTPRTERQGTALLIHPPALAPGKWYGYDGAAMVVIPRWASNMLDRDQLIALEQWVCAGGKLVVLGGRDAMSLRGSPLEPLLPARVRDLTEQEGALLSWGMADAATTLAKTVVANLELAGDGRAIWSKDGRILAARRKLGLGTIDLWACDLSAPSSGVRYLWSSLLGPAPALDRIGDFFMTFTSGFDFGMDVSKPNLGLIGLALLSYFLVVGPVNFYVLTRKKRLEWGWITVPAIVLVFSVALYGIAYHTKGGEMVSRTFTLIQAQSGQAQARAANIGGIFSPNIGRYPAAFAAAEAQRDAEPGLTLLPLTRWINIDAANDGVLRQSESEDAFRRGYQRAAPQSSLLGSSDAAQPVDQSRAKMQITALPLKQWGMAYMEGEGVINLGGTITADLIRNGREIKGEARNASSLYLQDVWLVVGQRAKALGDLAPGESVKVILPANGGVSLEEMEKISPSQTDWSKRFTGINNAAAIKIEQRVRAMFVKTALNRWPLGPCERGGETPLLVAWPRETPMRFNVEAAVTQSSYHTMLLCECEARVGPEGAQFSFADADNRRLLFGAAPLLLSRGKDGVEFYRKQSYQSKAEGPGIALTESAVTVGFVPPLAIGDGTPQESLLLLRYIEPSDSKLELKAFAYNFWRGRLDPLDINQPGEKRWIALNSAEHLNPFDRRVVIQLVTTLKNNAGSLFGGRGDKSIAINGLDAGFRFNASQNPQP
ncbi:MAG: hypothetical protein NTX50_02050 [Candidatus Sumerlaeota bacterium]|nr:hypothetical protein [Candidatus Sumerlaeota bacterium]